MEDSLLHCPICLDIADDAVETICCGNVYCEGCIGASGQNCPTCRKPNVQYRPSMLARRAIGSQVTDCPFLCGSRITRADVKCHVLLCDNRQYTCPDRKCGFIAKKTEIGAHIVQCHQNELIKNMEFLFNPPLPPPSYPGPHQDPIAIATNDMGVNCRLGESGKYYCGQTGCNARYCCDGKCGPTNGCNCASCQRLDLKMKKVPPGFLVNRQGALSRLGTTGKFYCGSFDFGNTLIGDCPSPLAHRISRIHKSTDASSPTILTATATAAPQTGRNARAVSGYNTSRDQATFTARCGDRCGPETMSADVGATSTDVGERQMASNVKNTFGP